MSGERYINLKDVGESIRRNGTVLKGLALVIFLVAGVGAIGLAIAGQGLGAGVAAIAGVGIAAALYPMGVVIGAMGEAFLALRCIALNTHETARNTTRVVAVDP